MVIFPGAIISKCQIRILLYKQTKKNSKIIKLTTKTAYLIPMKCIIVTMLLRKKNKNNKTKSE